MFSFRMKATILNFLLGECRIDLQHDNFFFFFLRDFIFKKTLFEKLQYLNGMAVSAFLPHSSKRKRRRGTSNRSLSITSSLLWICLRACCIIIECYFNPFVPGFFFHQFLGHNLRWALFVYRRIGATLIGFFFDDPFINWN